MQKFKSQNNTQYFLLPPSVEDFIKEDHLARLIDEVVDNIDTSVIENRYSYLGPKSYSSQAVFSLLQALKPGRTRPAKLKESYLS